MFNVACQFHNIKVGSGIVAYKDLGNLEFFRQQYHKLFTKISNSDELDINELELKDNLERQITDMEYRMNMVFCFTNLDVASKVLSCPVDDIVDCLNGTKETAGGYYFMLEKDYKEEDEPEVVKHNLSQFKYKRSKDKEDKDE